MTTPTLYPLDTLPALPLYPNSSMLDVRGLMLLSLHWLRGGRFTDYLNLDLSPEVIGAMLMQAAADHDRIRRYQREAAAYRAGMKDGMDRAFAAMNDQ